MEEPSGLSEAGCIDRFLCKCFSGTDVVGENQSGWRGQLSKQLRATKIEVNYFLHERVGLEARVDVERVSVAFDLDLVETQPREVQRVKLL